MLKYIGLKVAEIRMAGGTGRTQDWLSRQAKVSRNIVSNIETGKNYTVKNLAKVLLALRSDIDTVLNIDEVIEERRELHRKLNELLGASGKWPTSATENIELLHQLLRLDLQKKLPPPSSAGAPGSNG